MLLFDLIPIPVLVALLNSSFSWRAILPQTVNSNILFLSTFILDSDGYEFTIVSLDNKQWQFEAPTQDVSS